MTYWRIRSRRESLWCWIGQLLSDLRVAQLGDLGPDSRLGQDSGGLAGSDLRSALFRARDADRFVIDAEARGDLAVGLLWRFLELIGDQRALLRLIEMATSKVDPPSMNPFLGLGQTLTDQLRWDAIPSSPQRL